MKKHAPALLGLALLAGPLESRGEGFLCLSVDQNTRIEIYFSPESESASYSAIDKMVLKDPLVSPKRQLIAKFSAQDGLLEFDGNVITAYVDIQHPDSSRRGERIGGTVLGALARIEIEIDFSYAEPVQDGTRLSAQATYIKKNHEHLIQDFDCVRYPSLKKMARHITLE